MEANKLLSSIECCHENILENAFVRETSGNYRFLRSVNEDEIISEAKLILFQRLVRPKAVLNSYSALCDYLLMELNKLESEVFCVIFLNAKFGVIAFEKLFHGSICFTQVYPREVVKKALKYNAAAVIFAHNHPSQDPTPSQEDRHITKILKEALKWIDVKVINHFIVAGDKVCGLE